MLRPVASNETVITMVANNQERILRHNDICRALKRNAHTLKSTLDNVVDFLVRNGIVLDDVPEFKGHNTTTEFLTKHIHDQFAKAARDGGLGRDRANYGNETGTGPAVVNLSNAAIQYDADGAGPGAPVTVAAGTAIDTFGTIDTLIGIEDMPQEQKRRNVYLEAFEDAAEFRRLDRMLWKSSGNQEHCQSRPQGLFAV